MLTRFKRKGPARSFKVHNYVPGGGWHVAFKSSKGDIESRPVMFFGLATGRDQKGVQDEMIVPYVHLGGGTVRRFDPGEIAEYIYHPESTVSMPLKVGEGKSWKPTT